MLSANKTLEKTQMILAQQGALSVDALTPDIYDSWMRCISLGLDTRRPPPPEIVSAAVLRKEQERYSLTRGLALAEMHSLHQQIAGSNFMIAFATPEGVLLDFVSDRSFEDASGAASIRPGSIWSEAFCGTNGLGTAAHLKRQIVVHGSEHFFPRYNNLTCTASPIFAPDGTLAGVLDASSNCLSRQTHTQALVAMAATQIENGLFREKSRGNMIIAFHNRGEYLYTISAGLLAIDKDGGILAANRAAQVLLHGLPTAPGCQFSDIFRVCRMMSAVNSSQRLRTRVNFRWRNLFPNRGLRNHLQSSRSSCQLTPPCRQLCIKSIWRRYAKCPCLFVAKPEPEKNSSPGMPIWQATAKGHLSLSTVLHCQKA
jgi:sigma-54 dependent transcriptional regulator, acetoin dehydrogenase operon transcriptional activator AcoR